MIRLRPTSRAVAIIATLAVAGSSAAIVSAADLGESDGSASAVQYLTKPGCGPDGTDGVAGQSGEHTGQPPLAPERQDCPKPPGQQP